MPYSRVTRTAFGADAITYLLGNGTGHNGKEVRNLYIGSVNMLPNSVVPFVQQMQPIWDKADRRHTTQINRYVISFARSELDPDNPEDVVKAGAIGEEFARRIAPGHQSVIGVQDDGIGEKLHVHIDTNDGNMIDGKGIESSAYAHFHFQKIVDEICYQYFDLAKAEAQPERVNHAVQGTRARNEKIRAANELERKRAAEEGREVDPDKIKPERYIWQDDLRERIKKAAAESRDEAGFAKQLRLSGVELVPHKNKDGTTTYLHPATKKQPAHYAYELVDTSGFPDKVPQNLKSKSHKLGANYQPEGVAKLFGTAAPSMPQDDLEDAAPPVVFESETEDQYEAPPVFFEPSPRRRKPQKDAEKPKQEATEKPQEEKAMDDAKNIARAYAFTLMRRVYGWEKGADIDELDRQHRERDAAFEQFTKWRVDHRKELARNGEKLPGIYVKDKSSGYVSVPRGEFEKQFAEFLDRRNHPEKYAAIQEQPEQQPAPVEQPRPEQPQRAKQEKPPERAELAEQARREIAEGRSILYAELQRINAANEKRWREQEQQDGEEEDTVVKS